MVSQNYVLGIVASGSGSNLQSIINAVETKQINAKIGIVISNNSKAYCLTRAKSSGIKTAHLSNFHYPENDNLDQAFISTMENERVNLVVLAGYMKKRGEVFVDAFRNRILNIHPALIPRHCGKGMYGMNVHMSVIESGDAESGVTIHLVDEKYDNGEIVARSRLNVLPDDTPESLQKRVFQLEHKLYPEIIARICRNEIDLDNIPEKYFDVVYVALKKV